MDTFLFAHMPRQIDGKRAKAGRGLPAQSRITERNETEARRQFRELFPEREIVAVGVLGAG